MRLSFFLIAVCIFVSGAAWPTAAGGQAPRGSVPEPLRQSSGMFQVGEELDYSVHLFLF